VIPFADEHVAGMFIYNILINGMNQDTRSKMKESNPTISDLSDPNRTTKLAERYGELYDNEWTDAVEK